MPIFRIVVRHDCEHDGVSLNRGMSVDVALSTRDNPLQSHSKVVANAFKRIYGIDIRRAKSLNMLALDVELIG